MFLINNLTVVIVTYKTNDQILEECIESILGKAKILIDYWIDGQSTPGQVTPFPFKTSNQSLAKRNELIYITQR